MNIHAVSSVNSVAADGTYTCNRKTIIENYMPTEEYFWCDGEMFIRREYEHKNKRCDSNGDYVIYLQSGKYC